MIEQQFGGNIDMIVLLMAGLLLVAFGIIYNRYVEDHQDQAPVYVSLWVAFGVTVTLTVALVVELTGVLNWPGTLIALAGFICSGVPMIRGSLNRLTERRKDEAEVERLRARQMRRDHEK